MRRTVSLWTLVAVCVCIIAAFAFCSISHFETLDLLEQEAGNVEKRLLTLKAERDALENELELVGTDQYIENQARTKYAYVRPDEIRFEITNPEALYGEEGMPSR